MPTSIVLRFVLSMKLSQLISALFLTLLFLIFALPSAFAASYYISPNGDDSNSGTSAISPWKTIDKVNNTNFISDDQILFEGGQTFYGGLYFDNQDTGSPSNPIIIGSYGSGRALIHSDTSNGLYAYNTSGIKINNLNLVGAGKDVNTVSGISFYSDLAGNVKLPFIQIDNVSVSDYGQYGISIGGWNGNSGYSDIRITNVIVHDNSLAGINVWGQSLYSNQNVYIGHTEAYNNPGKSGLSYNSGSGIVVSSVDGGTIERSTAYNNGAIGFGNIGIWTYDSNNITIQFNESYSNKTGGSLDGGGFDLDGGVTNSVMQYNYSHDNDGAGYGLYQYNGAPTWSNNTVRYNISQNDARKNNYPAIAFWNGGNGLSNAEIYNNTIFISPKLGTNPSALAFLSGTNNIHIRNNIFITTGGVKLLDIPSGQNGLLFQGNNYFSSGTTFIIRWNGTNYTNLSDWKNVSGQEKIGSLNTGYSLDPQLTNAGGGGTIGNSDLLNTLAAYQLSDTSPMINTGLNLSTQFGINPGLSDFYGNTIPQLSQFDMGAHESLTQNIPSPTSTFTPTPTQTPTPLLTPSPTSTPTISVTRFYSTSGDGLVLYLGPNSVCNSSQWNVAENSSTGYPNNVAVSYDKSVGSGCNSTGLLYLARGFLAFDTSSLPDQATIVSAKIGLYIKGKFNSISDSNSFVSVVNGLQASSTTLVSSDYAKAGSPVINPTEGSDRSSINSIGVNQYTMWNLNTTGLSWISKTSNSKFAMREGHDILNIWPGYNYNKFISIDAIMSEQTGTNKDPYLEVYYY